MGEYGSIKVGQFPTVSPTVTYSNRRGDNDWGLLGAGSLFLVRCPGVNYSVKGFTLQLTSFNSIGSKDTSGIFDSDRYTNLIHEVESTLTQASARYYNVRYRKLVPKIELAYDFEKVPLKIFGAFAYFMETCGTNL